MRAALFAYSRGGCATARRVLEALPEEVWMCYTMPRFEEPGFLPLDKATWPEEKIFRCTVGTLHETVTGNGLTKTSLIVVGNCLGDTYLRSLLYHPNFTTEFRKGAQ